MFTHHDLKCRIKWKTPVIVPGGISGCGLTSANFVVECTLIGMGAAKAPASRLTSGDDY